MRKSVLTLAAIAVGAALGCNRPSAPPPPKGGSSDTVGSNNISAFSFFGAAHVSQVPGACAGRVQLAQGSATVKDTCFTGDTNVVLCTNASSAHPIRCTPERGSLTVEGSGSDMISYARVR